MSVPRGIFPLTMYDSTTRARALAALESGRSLNSVSRELRISRATLRNWLLHPQPQRISGCPRCEPTVRLNQEAYAHLLGLYLGDGCVSALAKHVYSLRIACADSYPGLIAAAVASVKGVRPGANVFLVPSVGCTHVSSSWKHWPCLFPQHGSGRKHERLIALEDWQELIVEEHPGPFLRGLFHSDGCRVTNWTVRRLKGGPRRYEYPRYFFSNESADILGICARTLDRVGVTWTRPRPNVISVARRESVAILDTMVGPKS